MTPEEMAYYKGCQDGRDKGKVAGYLLGLKHGKHTGLKVAYAEFKRIFWNEKWDINFMFVLKDHGVWLEQQIEELENAK